MAKTGSEVLDKNTNFFHIPRFDPHSNLKFANKQHKKQLKILFLSDHLRFKASAGLCTYLARAEVLELSFFFLLAYRRT